MLIPRTSPGFSATGALAAQPCIDEERSYIACTTRADIQRVRQFWQELDARAEQYLCAAGSHRKDMRCRYQLNLRYPGQNWSLIVDAAEIVGAQDM